MWLGYCRNHHIVAMTSVYGLSRSLDIIRLFACLDGYKRRRVNRPISFKGDTISQE